MCLCNAQCTSAMYYSIVGIVVFTVKMGKCRSKYHLVQCNSHTVYETGVILTSYTLSVECLTGIFTTLVILTNTYYPQITRQMTGIMLRDFDFRG